MFLKYEEQISMNARVTKSFFGDSKCQLSFQGKKYKQIHFVRASQILSTA